MAGEVNYIPLIYVSRVDKTKGGKTCQRTSQAAVNKRQNFEKKKLNIGFRKVREGKSGAFRRLQKNEVKKR